MPYYIAIAGEKRGPYPAYRVIDQLRGGEVSPDALGWEPGMDAWRPLREIPAFDEAIAVIENPPPPSVPGEDSADRPFADTPPPLPGQRPTSIGEIIAQARPFARFSARMIDYLIVMTVAWQFCDVPPLPKDISPLDLMRNDGTIVSQETLMRMAAVHYAALVIWVFVEALLIHRFGATPGKALLGVRVTAENGTPLPLLTSLGRAFVAWMAGFGFGLTPFNLIGSAAGLGMILYGGGTLWDRMFAVRVPVSAMSPARFLMAIGFVFLLLILSSLKFS